MTDSHCDSGVFTGSCVVVIENRCMNYTIDTYFIHAVSGTEGRWCTIEGIENPTQNGPLIGPSAEPGKAFYALAGPGPDNWSPDLTIRFAIKGTYGTDSSLNDLNIRWTLHVYDDANDCGDGTGLNTVDYGKDVSLTPPLKPVITQKVVAVMQNYLNRAGGAPSSCQQGTRIVFYEPWQLTDNKISGTSMSSSSPEICNS
jgi:hypothetical protein